MISIKKYSNRRLYDTTHSRYVNLEDVEELVGQGLEVEVLDEKTGKDVTRAVFTQIILEGAKRHDRALPAELLRQMIIASGRAQQDLLNRYLTFVFGFYDRAQNEVRQRLSDTREQIGNPMDSVFKSMFPHWKADDLNDDQISIPDHVDDNRESLPETVETPSVSKETLPDPALELAELRKRIEFLETRLTHTSDENVDSK